MIRYAVVDEKQELLDIFNICFPGEEDFSFWFFSEIYDYKNTIVYEDGGKIIAALQMLPVKLLCGGVSYSSAYLYGVGTLPEYRGNGIMAKLIDFSCAECMKKGIDYSILIVQTPSLLDYYAGFGFQKFFSVDKKEKTVTAKSDIDFRPLRCEDIEKIDEIYRRECQDKLFAERDDIGYRDILNMYKDAAFVCEKDGEITAYSFGYFTEKAYVAAEAIGKDMSALMNAVAIAHNKEKYICTFPGNSIYIGMIKNISSDIKNIEGYINLLYN